MPSPLPYPVQSNLLSPLRREAIARDRIDLVSLWAGQGTPLLRYHRAADLFAAFVRETTAVLEPRGVGRTHARELDSSRGSASELR